MPSLAKFAGGDSMESRLAPANILGIQNGKELTTLYLCGIDSKGMFWLIAPLQKAVATPEIIQEIKTSMLTFKRAE